MPQRFYTLIVVPNASSRLHKVRIPFAVMYVLAAIGIVSFFVAAGLGFNYARMAFKVADYNSLQAENTELKVEKMNLEVSTKKLSSKISNLESLSQKLTESTSKRCAAESDWRSRKPGNQSVRRAELTSTYIDVYKYMHACNDGGISEQLCNGTE